MHNLSKIRGWRRRVRQLDQWLEKFQQPDLNGLNQYFDAFVKIWIDPWYRLQKTNPPLRYFHLILDRFSIMYDRWQTAVSQAPFDTDLQLWIFEKNYIESELVCARVDTSGELRNNYFDPCPEKRSFPASKFDGKGFLSEEWNWTLFYASNHYFAKMDSLSDKEIQNLLDNGFAEEIVFPGQKMEDRHFSKPYDYVWVGRKK